MFGPLVRKDYGEFEGQGIFLILNNGNLNAPFISIKIGWWVTRKQKNNPEYHFYGVKVTMKASGEITKIETTNGRLFKENFNTDLWKENFNVGPLKLEYECYGGCKNGF